jgi:PleD family two-component response regulator
MAKSTTFTEVDNILPDSFGKKILILDDVLLVGRTVCTQLKMAGFSNVRFETDARLAMDVIAEFQPDMILLDIFMPHISGLELLQQIRANEDFNHIIVVMLSSAGRDEQYKSLELGALGFIQKPTTAGRLVQTVTSKFGVARRLGIQ